MRMLTFARRNAKEILRDPLNLAFMFGFPLVLILLLSAIQANVPVPLFEIAHLAPGVTVFGLAFMTLFSATIIDNNYVFKSGFNEASYCSFKLFIGFI